MIQNAIVGALMALGGLYLMYVGLKIKAKIKEARLWPHARGRLTKLKTIGQGTKVIGTDDYRQYMLRISYDYEVKGQEYTHDRAVFGSDIEVKAEIDEFCGHFQEDSEVRVFYNPEDPQDAVLLIDRPGGKQSREYYFGVGLVMFGVIIGVIGGGYLS